MRSLVVEHRGPVVARTLLLFLRRGCAILKLGANVDVHALVRAVVLRASWAAPYEVDTERHPPSRELSQPPRRADRCERRPLSLWIALGIP